MGVRAPQPQYIFALPWYVLRLFPTVRHWYVCIVYWIEVNLKNLKTTLINRTRLRTKGQSASYPQAQLEITSNSFQRRAP